MTDLLTKFGDLLKDADTKPTIEAPFEVKDNITHKLTFHKGRAKNFRSVGNEFMEIDYQRNQATLVTSDDNGAGKSTMLVWLLFFVLYNDTYSKKEKKGGLVNSQNKKDCVGEVEFSCRGSEWKVRRGIKPDFVEVHQKVDGQWKQIDNDAAKSDTNKYIVNLIGVDQKMFENSLVLGKEKFIPFTEMYTADRRVMVETIWDLEFFSVMNEEVKASIKSVDKLLSDLSNEFSLKMVDHTNKKSQLAQINHSNSLIQQQSADILVQEKQRLSDLDADLTAQQDELYHFHESLAKVSKDIEEVEERLNNDSLEEIEGIKKEYDQRINDILDEARGKAEDYQRIEVSEGEKVLQEIRDRTLYVHERKSDLVNQRNVNLEETNRSIQRQNQAGQFRVRFQTELDGHQAAIKRFHDMGVCPTCTQVVSEDTKSKIEGEYVPQIEDLRLKLAQLDGVAEEVQSAIDKYKEKDAELASLISTVDAELDTLRDEANKAQADVNNLQRDIKDFYDSAEAEKASLIREMQDKILTLRKANTIRFMDITASLQQTQEQASNSVKAIGDKITELKQRRAPLVASIADLERKLSVQPTPTADLEAEIAEIEKSLNDLEMKRQLADEDLQDHNHLLHYLKDDQTKARIISLYLPFLNSKINEYLEGMNMFLDIQVDDTFDITMGTAGRKGQSLFSLSSGQRVRVNIAITMALRDVANLKASVQCNILVFDEVLENLSERGVQECIEMLKHKFSGNNLFVISQREQEFQEYFEHNIRYGLRNGMTEIISKD